MNAFPSPRTAVEKGSPHVECAYAHPATCAVTKCNPHAPASDTNVTLAHRRDWQAVREEARAAVAVTKV
eukprot:992059-Prorocentrum_minimum.AAC.1